MNESHVVYILSGVGQELYAEYLSVSILMSVFLDSHYFGGMTES